MSCNFPTGRNMNQEGKQNKKTQSTNVPPGKIQEKNTDFQLWAVAGNYLGTYI